MWLHGFFDTLFWNDWWATPQKWQSINGPKPSVRSPKTLFRSLPVFLYVSSKITVHELSLINIHFTVALLSWNWKSLKQNLPTIFPNNNLLTTTVLHKNILALAFTFITFSFQLLLKLKATVLLAASIKRCERGWGFPGIFARAIPLLIIWR